MGNGFVVLACSLPVMTGCLCLLSKLSATKLIGSRLLLPSTFCCLRTSPPTRLPIPALPRVRTVRDSGLTPTDGDSPVRLQAGQGDTLSGRVSRDEVAQAVVAALGSPYSNGKTFELRRDEVCWRHGGGVDLILQAEVVFQRVMDIPLT